MAYCIEPVLPVGGDRDENGAEAPYTLSVAIHCATVRQLRLSTNAVLENATLVVETMQAFAPGHASGLADTASAISGNAGAVPSDTLAREDATAATGRLSATAAAEFELNGIGRAG